MKIISWNCYGAFRKKYEFINRLNPDIVIIQECEDPLRSKDKDYKDWASNHQWIGDTKNKGVGIFAMGETSIQQLHWSNYYEDHIVKYFLPVLVNDDFQLLGIWAHRNNSPNFGYIGQFWKYLKTNIEKFDDIIIAGDLNSNAIWDQWDRWWNHTDVVNILANKNIQSVYHYSTKEAQGQEKIPTFFLQRKSEKPYHIDYMFSSSKFMKKLKSYEILTDNQWLEISDHRPIIMEINI